MGDKNVTAGIEQNFKSRLKPTLDIINDISKEIDKLCKEESLTLFDVILMLEDVGVWFRYQSGLYWLTDGVNEFGKVDLSHLEVDDDRVKISDYVFATLGALDLDLEEHEQIAYSEFRQTVEKTWELFNKLNYKK